MNPGILARRDVTYASMPWSTACCSVLCSPLSMIVQPDNAREEIGVPSLALSARTTLGFYVTIPHPWTDAGGVPGACGLCQPSNKPTVCPSIASRNLVLYQSLPISIPYRHAILWRRKDDTSRGHSGKRNC